MQNQRFGLLALAAVGMIATFLPWINVPMIGSVAGSDGDGWITFALFGAALAMILLADKSARPKSMQMWSGIAALLAAGIGIWKIIDFNSKLAEMGSSQLAENMAESISIGMGLYLVVICGILFAILAFILNKNTDANVVVVMPTEPSDSAGPTTSI